MLASRHQCGDGLADRLGFCTRFHQPLDFLHTNLSCAGRAAIAHGVQAQGLGKERR